MTLQDGSIGTEESASSTSSASIGILTWRGENEGGGAATSENFKLFLWHYISHFTFHLLLIIMQQFLSSGFISFLTTD